MSNIISRTQYRVPQKEKEIYKPLEYSISGLEVNRVAVNFGHPLYPDVADIFYVESVVDQICCMPMIPDGCNTLVVRSMKGKSCGFVCGSIDEIRKLEIYPNERVIFIKFNPGVGHSLLNRSSKKLTNCVMELHKCVRNAEQILETAKRDIPVEQIISIISMLIRADLYKEKRLYLIKFCTDKIIGSEGNISIAGLAEDTGFTERHISKMFDIYVGLSPKLFSQIIRLQNTMKQIMEGNGEPLVEVAIANGFFDHAHMNRTYNKFIHCSAGDFRQFNFSELNFDEIDSYVYVA